MIDANSQFFAILTNVGMAKQANADALGIPWKITDMGVGDANGTDPIPNAAQTALIHEWRRRPLNQLKIDPNNPAVIIAEQIIPADEGGKWIREIGLYDADGDLVAVANCAPSFKPVLSQGSGRTQIVRMNFIVTSSGNITLKIDPAVVLATRDYVDLRLQEELYKLDSKQSARVASTGNIVLAGAQQIDGVAVVAGQRVLVTAQASAKDNGLWLVANGAWSRAFDADISTEVTPGLFVTVEEGTLYGDSLWQLVTNAPIVLGTTALAFEMLAGKTGIGAGTYRSLTVDKYGRVIAGTNPTTLAGFGVEDAYTKQQTQDLLRDAMAVPLVNVSATKSLISAELGLVLVDASAAAVVVTLPAANAGLGIRNVVIRRIDNGGNRLTVAAAGTDKIKFHTHLRAEGYPFFVLMGSGDFWHLRSDGAGNWYPVARFDNTPLGRPVFETTTAITPGGWGLYHGLIYNRAEWPWTWDHAQASGMLTTEALRVGNEGKWTSGDGALTFRTPEGRGEFPRFLDEGRGVDTGRVAGNNQKGSMVASDYPSAGQGAVSLAPTSIQLPADYGFDPLTTGDWTGLYVVATAALTPIVPSSGPWMLGASRPRNIANPGRLKLI